LILLGLILALGTAGAVFVLLQTSTSSAQAPEIKREEVLVAIQPVAEDELVDGRLGLRPIPVDSIPEAALDSLDGTSGMIAAGPIPQGTIIQPALLLSPEERMAEGELGQLVEPGFVAIAMPIDELSSVSYGLRPGDHIDVLMSFFFVDIDPDAQIIEPVCPPECPATTEGGAQAMVSEQIPRPVAQLTLQDIPVLGVGRWEVEEITAEEEQEQQRQDQESVAPDLPDYITVMVTRQDALVLKMAREQNARIDLAIRAEDDIEQLATQPVTLDYIMARFGINLPAKQAYTLQPAPQQTGGE
jgi:pilus assembly protein CpaB